MTRKEFIRIDQGSAFLDDYNSIYSVFMHCYQQESYGILSFDIDSIGILAKVLRGELLIEAVHLSYKGKKLESKEFTAVLKEKTTYIDGLPFFSTALSITDNVFISKQMRGIVNRKKETKVLSETLAFFEIPISLNTPVAELEAFEIYELELIQAYIEKKDGIILDFNTLNMSYEQFVRFKQLVRRLENMGMTCIWLDINVQRAASMCDAMMLFYGRKTARLLEYGPFSEREILSYIPTYIDDSTIQKYVQKADEIILELKHVSTPLLEDINLRIGRSEMCMIFVRNRNELLELVEVLRGNISYTGTVLFRGRDIKNLDVYQRLNKGICFLEWENCLIAEMTVYDNLCLPHGLKVNNLWRNKKYQKSIIADIEKWIGKNLWQRYVYELPDEYRIKLAYYKWLLYRPEILFILMPFTTLDKNMNEWIRNIMYEFTVRHTAIISFMDYEFRNENEKGSAYLFDKTIRAIDQGHKPTYIR